MLKHCDINNPLLRSITLPMDKLNRRKALKRISLIMGSSLSASMMAGVLAGCQADPSLDWTPKALTTKQAQIVSALVERILPATQTPGAKEALVDRFVDRMLDGFLQEVERQVFVDGLRWLEKRKFTSKSPEMQDQLVTELAEEARQTGKSTGSKPFFLLAKEMTLLGFFTSEVGATQVLNYDPIPGGYQGCISLEEAGGKTWAT